MFSFSKAGKGQLINLREESLSDRETGKDVTFYRVDIVGEIDGVRQCFQLTCGKRALTDWRGKVGDKVDFVIAPKPRGGVSLQSLTVAA